MSKKNELEKSVALQLYMQLYDKGLISKETLLSEFDIDFNTEMELIKNEQLKRDQQTILSSEEIIPNAVNANTVVDRLNTSMEQLGSDIRFYWSGTSLSEPDPDGYFLLWGYNKNDFNYSNLGPCRSYFVYKGKATMLDDKLTGDENTYHEFKDYVKKQFEKDNPQDSVFSFKAKSYKKDKFPRAQGYTVENSKGFYFTFDNNYSDSGWGWTENFSEASFFTYEDALKVLNLSLKESVQWDNSFPFIVDLNDKRVVSDSESVESTVSKIMKDAASKLKSSSLEIWY